MPRTRPASNARMRRGMAIIYVTLTVMVILGLVGLALDTGYAVLVGTQLQNAADAAALAGARIVAVAPTGARTAAVNIGALNNAAGAPVQIDPNADITVGTYNTTTKALTPGTLTPNAVRVTARRVAGVGAGAVPLFFGGAFGTPTLNMSRVATAISDSIYSPALVVLDPAGSCALDVSGGGILATPGSSIQVNSTNATAACFSGNSNSSATYLNVTGGVSGADRFAGTINTGVPPIPDPLASLPAPPIGSPLGARTISPRTTVTLDPGYYNGGINVQGTLILKPGIYIIGGDGFKANSQASITGLGVMIYITDGAALTMSSSQTSVTLRPPDPDIDAFVGADIYEGVSIFQDRADTSMCTLPLSGSFNISGTLYFPTAELRVTAGGSLTGVCLIVYDLTMRGSTGLNLTNPNGLINTGRPYLVE